MHVPGINRKMAHEFDEYRPYTSMEQFRREIGKYVDEAEVARFEQYVFVPLGLNSASEEDFATIPGNEPQDGPRIRGIQTLYLDRAVQARDWQIRR